MRYVQHKTGSAPSTPAARIGVATHRALEDVIAGRRAVKEAVYEAYMNERLTTNEMEEVASYSQNIQNFYDRFQQYKQKNHIVELHTERKFALDADMHEADWHHCFFRGAWDLVALAQRPEGQYLIIIDHKSGEVRDLDSYSDQLKLYAVSGLCTFPQVLGVQSGVHFVQSEEISFNKMQSSEVIKSTLFPWFVNLIERAAVEAEKTEPRVNNYCRFCEYPDTCPLR
jgi:hypothetical protein